MNVNKRLVIVLVSFFSLNAQAITKNETTETIPFITYKSHVVYYSVPITTPNTSTNAILSNMPSFQGSMKFDMSSSATMSTVEEDATTSNIPIKDVQNLIRQVRDAVCNSIGDSDVKVWVSIDASGKLLGVGASTQSGLEITFHCKGK